MTTALERFRGWLAERIAPANWIPYDGAGHGRRGKGWNDAYGTPDDLARWSVYQLRNRSRHLVRNHWAAERAVSVLTAKIVGTGIMPSARDAPDFDALLRSWSKPQAQVGSMKGQSLAGVQRLACRSIIESGAAITVRQWRTPRQMRERGLVMPFQLAVLEPDYLDCSRDNATLPNGNRLRDGIEYDKTGWPVAYYLHKSHPASQYPWDTLESVRVPAGDVAYTYFTRRPGETIPVPWLTPVLVKLRDFDEFDDAQLMRQKIAAMFAAFIRRAPNARIEDTIADDDMSLEPGLVQWLEPGEEVTFSNPPDVAAYAEVARVSMRAASAGVGLSYEDMSNDYSQVNFTSGRMGAMVTNTLNDQWQGEMMIGGLCSMLELWARQGAMLLGVSPADAKWTAPSRPLIDPSREVGAIVRGIEAGLNSRQDEIGKLGRSVHDVDAERAEDKAREEILQLTDDADDAVTAAARTIRDLAPGWAS